MDLNSIGQKSLENVNADSLWLEVTQKEIEEKKLLEELFPSDSTSASELEQLKNHTKKADEPGRAAYIESLKLAAANGDLEIAAGDIAEAILDDGYEDFFKVEEA